MFKRYNNLINALRVVLDIAVIILSFFLSYYLRFGTDLLGKGILSLTPARYATVLWFVVPINILGYKISGLYDSLRTKRFALQMRNILIVYLISLAAIFVYLFISREVNYSRLLAVVFIFVSFCATVLMHFTVKKILIRMRIGEKNLRYTAVVGAGRMGQEYLSKIRTHPEFGYQVSAFFDDNARLKNKKVMDVPVAGRVDALETYLKDNYIDLLVIALPNNAVEEINQVINVAELYGVKSQIIPDFYKVLPSKPLIDDIDGLPLVHTRFVPLDIWFNKVMKRAFDLIVSLIALILLLPFLLLVALIVKLTSPGPVIYKQKRVGYNRREFNIYKFRSMRYVKEDKPGWTTEDDDRRTKFGEFMRKNNIDELLQLFNVLKGDMSLVGPRPEQPAFVEQFMYEIPKYMIKHHVKPGITGWAQVNGWRGDTSIEERIKCDIYYIEYWTFGFDIRIIFMTAFGGTKNAY